MKRIPHGLLSRSAATGRLIGRIGLSGAKRLVVGRSEDAALGDAMFAELDRMKGMAMKVGQILSYMDVGLPDDVAERLARLQTGAEPYDPEAIRGIVESALGAPLDTLFERFDPEPVAAASVGQVHRARIAGRALADGEVAVKVRYPEVLATIEADFAHLDRFARLASLATAVDGAALVDELRARMVEECDYAAEARNQQHFAALLADAPGLHVPEVVQSHSTGSVLTTTWDSGTSFEALRAASAPERAFAAEQLVHFAWAPLFEHGIIHADPHPGNFRFRPDRVTVLDFGCVRRFEPAHVEAFRQLSRVVVEGRRPDLPDALLAHGIARDAAALDRLDLDELWGMMRWMYSPYLEPRFHGTRTWWVDGMRAHSRPSNPNGRRQSMLPHTLWLMRLQAGLHAVLVKLDVEVALRDRFLELLHTPLVRSEAA